jgi:hypothetical protein
MLRYGVGRLTASRSARAWLALCALAVTACSSPGAKAAFDNGQATRASSSAQATVPLRTNPMAPPSTVASTTALPPPTVTTAPPTTGAPTTSSTAALSVAPAAALTAGQWTAVGLLVNGAATLTATLLPGRPGGPLSGVVRINEAVTRLVLYAGTVEPGGTWLNQGAVAAGQRGGLVAAFNAGFHTYASGGGWFDHGRAAVPLGPGVASLVIRADGSATVGMWGRDVTLTSDVVSVRQNLGLLVDGGANLAGTSYWGATLGGVRYTWRSGVGVDAAGDLLYAGGPGLDAQSLAQVLIDAGAVRAMELDINPQWVSFSYYSSPDTGTDLLSGMLYGPSRWLSGSTRDFFAVFVR